MAKRDTAYSVMHKNKANAINANTRNRAFQINQHCTSQQLSELLSFCASTMVGLHDPQSAGQAI